MIRLREIFALQILSEPVGFHVVVCRRLLVVKVLGLHRSNSTPPPPT